jgi:nucleoid-associated protein YgaU
VLASAWGRPPSDAEIVPYWRQLIEVNRAVLADRDNPDLIFPGQLFTVPAP